MRKLGRIMMVFGAVLVIAALSLFLYNIWEDRQAALLSETLVEDIAAAIDADAQANPYDTTMTEVEIDGYYYIGYLSLPTLGLNLPVMSSWSYDFLKISPCRYSGSTKSGDLVIAAHNYSSHFGQIKNLEKGDDVYFVDMDGRLWHYQVAALETLAPTDIELMTNGGYDLTLFTCTYGGQSRVTVRCSLVEE